MEALAAIGLASAIVQFVDFSSRLIAGAKEVYSSASGMTAASDDSDVMVNNLKDLTRRLKVQTTSETLSAEDKNLVSLQQGCEKLSYELQELLQTTKPKKRGSKLSSIRASLKAQSQKEKLASIEKRLDRYRIQILGQLLGMMSDNVSNTYHLLQSSAQSQERYAQETRDEIRRTRDDITNSIRSELQKGKTPKSPAETLERMCQSLTKLQHAVRTVPLEDEILQRLWFPQIGSRERTVEEAHKRTFRWLLHTEEECFSDSDSDSSNTVSSEASTVDDEAGSDRSDEAVVDSDTGSDSSSMSSAAIAQQEAEYLARKESREHFIDWLEAGSGVFYMSGKAGSGKSTLMKYVAHDQKTRQRLDHWAKVDGKTLVFARFFFWNSATPIQRNLEGLYRSILWEILRQCPNMIPKVFPKAWASDYNISPQMTEYPFELMELRSALDQILGKPEILIQHKICLLIDGLDEFEGDYWQLADRISSWAAKSKNVKFCLSSRPLREFLQKFASIPEKSLQLQDLTQGDMYRVVRAEFRQREKSGTLHQQSTHYHHRDFINAIVSKSDGVFLWVRLATSSILKGIGDNYSITQLYRKLDSVPHGLDAMLRQMLDSIDRPDRKRASQMFLTMIYPSQVGRWVYTQGVLDDLFDQPGLQTTLLSGDLGKRLNSEECHALCSTVGARLIARCKGLVEIIHCEGENFPFCHEIQFVHRTVSDFFSDPDNQDELRRAAGSFSAPRALAQALLCIVKYIDLQFASRDAAAIIGQSAPGKLSYPPGHDIRMVIGSFFHLPFLADSGTCPPFVSELKSMISMLEEEAGLRADDAIYLGGFKYDSRMRTVYSTDVISVKRQDLKLSILRIGMFHNADLVRSLISSDPSFIIPRPQGGHDFLLSGAVGQLLLGHLNRYDPTILPWLLARNDIDPNAESRKTCTLREIRRTNTLVEDSVIFSFPPWTTWTCLLVKMALNVRGLKLRGFARPSNAIAGMIEAFLSHGADPSVCFIGYELEEEVDGRRRARGPSYMNLEAMMRLWQVHPTLVTRDMLGYLGHQARSWPPLSRLLGRLLLGYHAPTHVTMESVAPEDVTLAGFVTLKVTPREDIGSVSLDELESTIALFCESTDIIQEPPILLSI